MLSEAKHLGLFLLALDASMIQKFFASLRMTRNDKV